MKTKHVFLSFNEAISRLQSDINTFILFMETVISKFKPHEYQKRVVFNRAKQIALQGLEVLERDLPDNTKSVHHTKRYLYAHRVIQARRYLQEAQNLVELEVLTSAGAWR